MYLRRVKKTPLMNRRQPYCPQMAQISAVITRVVMMALVCMGCLWGTAQTFEFRQVYTDNACMVKLMENITKVIHDSPWPRDANCHYLSMTKEGADTVLEIHSYDAHGFYSTLQEQEILGVCLLLDHEFYIDTSLASWFDVTDPTFIKRYDRKRVEENRFTINDCYYHWLFKRDFCGIALYKAWTMNDFKGWYNLELDTDCFCDYRKMSVELIEEEPEEMDMSRP